MSGILREAILVLAAAWETVQDSEIRQIPDITPLASLGE
jgi:hypothetical protein